MSFLLDTNVVSEWVKPQPNPNVVTWLNEVDEDRVFLSVASLAEIRQGVELMPSGKRRDHLFAWLTGDLPARFEGRILDIDQRTAEAWGIVMARGTRLDCVHVMDAFFAATAEVHQTHVGDPQRSTLPEVGHSPAESLATGGRAVSLSF